MRCFALVLMLVWLGAPAFACCMVPASYKGDVDQKGQEAVILFHDGHEELILRVQPFFQAAEDAPPYMAWVVTVPSRPTAYNLADPGVFDAASDFYEKLYRLAEKQWDERTQFVNPFSLITTNTMDGAAAGCAAGLDIGAPIKVGPYAITPVHAQGLEALDELNSYLAGRGFPTEDAEHMRWFVENDFTFLCIYIVPPPGTVALGMSVDLPPLQISFDTDRPYYPGKFSSQQGNFSLSLTIVTSAPLETRVLARMRKKLNATNRASLVNLYTLKGLPALLSEAGKSFASGGADRWHFNHIWSPGFNQSVDGKPAIAAWDEDIRFEIGDNQDAIPGWWYYADAEIGGFELFVRRHLMAMVFLLGIFFFGSLLWRTYRQRARAARGQAPPA